LSRGITKTTLEQQVLDFIQEKQLLSSGQMLVVAVSGGPDSVCMLYVLADLCRELDVALHIAHLNHQLRGKDSEADAAYVGRLARRLGIPATIESWDIQTYRKNHKLSLEEAAREVRYSFLVEVAANAGAACVAVGHTADDHIETILMHLLRGSGNRGLRGLMPLVHWKSAAGDLTIIRPLLNLSRGDTVAYCRQHRLKPRTDASNLSTESFRNRIRHDLLPELRKYNPQIAGALLRMAGIVTDDLDYIDGEGARLWKDIASYDEGALIIDKQRLLNLPPALQRYLLRRAVESALGSLKDIEAVHIEDILNALEKPAGKAIGLPFGINFSIEYDRYILAPDFLSLCPLPPLEGETAVNIPGKTSLPGWDINASIMSMSEFNTGKEENTDFTAFFDYDRTGNRLTVRCRRPGDRFQPLGMEKPKKLKEFMIDARIPRSWRRRVPIVTSPEQIIWVAGWRIDERVKVAVNTSSVLRLELKQV
jgi:tRNA(Ile)-lysidine synthase